MLLEAEGYEVETAPDGNTAIQKVKVRVAMEKEESSPQSFLRGLDVQRIHSCILDGLPWFSMIDRMHRAPSASVD